MIFVKVDGQQLTQNGQEVVRLMPYSVRSNVPGNFTVGTSILQVLTPFIFFGTKNFFINFRNVSTNGQTIGIDVDNTFVLADCGILLFPGESIQLQNMFTPFWAIADAAGAELRRFVMVTA